MTSTAGRQVHVSSFRELEARTAYLLWQLRVDVFVVEQECAYPELDGRDLEAGTQHVWSERGDVPVAYLRMVEEADGSRRIGRVCTSAKARGDGLAGLLLERALREAGGRRCVLDAQAQLAHWYARRGFEVTGPEFVEDGIPHLPMALDGPAGQA